MAVQLILKNSSVADRRPTANQLGNGEISLNFNAAGAFLSCRDTNGDIQQVGGVKVSETAPAAPARQTAWVKPSTRTLSIYSGSSWIDIGAVTSVNGQSGVVTLTKANIGLGNVDNTSDLNKPVSTATQNALNAKADLVGGKVPTSQLPSLAVSEYLGPAANQAAMLLLSGERGDWCIRTDLSSTFVLISDGGSSIGDWQELATPASPVSSVNGYTGAVVLGAADVGAATTAQGVLADSALQPGDNISELTNDENYITSAEAPVQSVNTQTGAVVLDAADVGAVNLTGDNMTGDLTLGTSNIVLNAGNGSAEFAGSTYRFGTFDSTNVTSADSGADIRLGTLSLKRNDTDGNPIFKGYNTSGTVSSRIYGTGLAEFGSIEVDNLTLDASTLSSSGTLKIQAGGTGAVSFQTKDTNGNYTFKTTDESLNGRLQFNDITAQRTYKYPDQNGTVVVKDSTTGALTINGNYQAGGNPASGAADGCRMDSSGTVRAARTSGSGAIWTGYQVGTAPTTSRINADGSASYSGTVTATVVPPSDARFKENITPANPQLADIVALGGLLKNYNWNDKAPLNEELRSQRQLGLIAQEVAEVCPSITKTIHRTRTVETKPAVTDGEGAVVTEAVTKEVDESYQGISQDALIMKLLGAVAELKAEVDALSGLVVVGRDYIAS